MATVQAAIVNRALRLIGKLASGASPTSDESNDTLTALNAMIDAWRPESGTCYALREETLTLTNGASSKTIGASGDLNTVRPLEIEAAYILDDGISHPVRMITDVQYAGISDKTSSGDWPTRANYKAAYPLGVIYLWPVPNATRTMKLLTKVPHSAMALSDTLAVPPGWEEALVYNLAIRMAPEFEVAASADVVEIARTTKGAIKRQNVPNMRARNEVAQLVGGASSGNILTDQ